MKRTKGKHGVSPEMFASTGSESSGSSPTSGHPPSRPESGRPGEFVVQEQSATDIGSPKRKVKRPTFGFSASFETGESSHHEVVRRSESSSPSPVSGHQPTPMESRHRGQYVAKEQLATDIGSPKRKVKRPSLGFSAWFETVESSRHQTVRRSEESDPSPALGHPLTLPESGRPDEYVTQAESSVYVGSPKRKVKRPTLGFSASFETVESSRHETVRRSEGSGPSPALDHPLAHPGSGRTGKSMAQAQSSVYIGSPKRKVKRPSMGFSASFETVESSHHETVRRSEGSGPSLALGHRLTLSESGRPDEYVTQAESSVYIGSPKRKVKRPSLGFSASFETGESRRYDTMGASESSGSLPASGHPPTLPESSRFSELVIQFESSVNISSPKRKVKRPTLGFSASFETGEFSRHVTARRSVGSGQSPASSQQSTHQLLPLAISQINLEVSSSEVDDGWHSDASALAAAFYVPGLGNISPSLEGSRTMLQQQGAAYPEIHTSRGSDDSATELQTAAEAHPRLKVVASGGSTASQSQEPDYSPSPSFSELLVSARYTHSKADLLPSRGRRLKTLQAPPGVLVPEQQKEELALRRRRAVEEDERKSRALQEDSFYNFQLRMDANEYPIKTKPKCQCNVIRHPSSWSVELIVQVHDYSILLNLRDQVRITKDLIVLMNDEESSVVCEVPMVQDNPFKKKVEEAIRYTDVETEVGDMTVFDLNYYIQPLDRKIFVMVSGHRVEGLVVAEPLAAAHRIRTEIPEGYRELEVTPTPVRVGINRIWVHVSRRRERWATMLCDLVRYKFSKGEILERTDVAFNIGTDSGMSFAKVYLKTTSVPLYPGVTGIRTIIEPQDYETR